MYEQFLSELVQFMIDAGIASRREISGCTDDDIAAVEHEYAYHLPEAFKACLRVMGRKCGKLSDCDRFGVDAFAEAKEVAIGITTDEDAPWQLPECAVPFLQHQGYNFLYLRTDCGDDPPVWYYVETHREPGQAASSFTGWLRDTALLCVEHKPWNDEVCREITIHRENWLARKHVLDEYDAQVATMRDSLSDRILLSDHQRGRISDPREFQKLWNAEFTNTELYHTLVAEGKRVPWGWVNPRDA